MYDVMFSNTGWIRVWFYWLGYAIVATPVILAFSKATRRDALIVLLTNISVIVSMGWLYRQIGYVRLLGIVHVILWTPLFVYLFGRAKNGEMILPFRLVIWLFVATLAVSLAFDYVDVVRYLLGERGSMIE
ncbi:MAG: hypothetical protein CL799_11220 [Chromatiales bacterium]|jgi:hypothetical protein|nr:hypothetical protein [Chromatiales bacterium]MDP7270396.1 hypothetical protein [Gammaproteobacteria bacterium]